MTAPVLWAVVALAALLGWAVTLVFLSKSLLPQSHALSTLLKADAFVDDRIAKTIGRIRERQQPKAAPPATTPQRNAAADQMAAIFGPGPLMTPVDEQPGAEEGLEVVS